MNKYRKPKSYNKVLLEVLSTHPVSFIPCLGHLAGSATAGLFMSQMLYWANKGKNPDWIYKSMREFQDETCLSRSEQDVAIKKWKELGVLEVKLKGIPCVRHFKVDFEKLINLLKEFLQKSSLQDSANKFADNNNLVGKNPQTTTESTPESSLKNTNSDIFLKRQKLQTFQLQKQKFINNHKF